MSAFESTPAHLESARAMGERHAKAEQNLDVLFPSDPITDEEDERTLLWKVTGEKLRTEQAPELITAYEEAYWEVWDAD